MAAATMFLVLLGALALHSTPAAAVSVVDIVRFAYNLGCAQPLHNLSQTT